ncbi:MULTISPECIES: DUF6263 family protein [Trichocoleus]|uniref:DUF6263 family protein n=1 Tax=Trichocoleus desertorum GB2-A4 TaxID=2933944 RepID=A0ABV0J5S6_9CYAN|nr:DUF6263 family protein [Trichocoleus sp. FACHB-46]
MVLVNVKKLGIVAAALGMSFIAIAADAAPVKLQLRLQKGDRYSIQMATDQAINQSILGRPQNTNQVVRIGYLFDVIDVAADGTSTVKMTYKSVQFKQSGPNGAIAYDSTRPAPGTNPLTASLSTLVGQSISAKITPAGTVREVQGIDQLIARMISGMKIPNNAVKAQIENTLRSQFGEEMFKELFSQSLDIYPTQPINVGDSWSKKMTLSKGFPMTVETTYTLKAVKNNIATVDISSQVKPSPNAPALQISGASLKQNLAGTQKGSMQIQLNTGMVTQSQVNQDISGKFQVQGLPGASQAMSWPVSVKGTVSIEQTLIR